MWRPWFIAFLVCVPAFGEVQKEGTTLSVGPEGVSVSGGDRNLGFSAQDGNAQVNFSLTGSPPTYVAPIQSQSPYLVVPNPTYQPPRPSSALTDSDTFFKSIGKDYELPKEYRHRRKDQ
jgi:hypothetical protein